MTAQDPNTSQSVAQPDADPPARLRIRLIFGSGAKLGPGKADLLEAIESTGSISGAGRSMGMSYKRAWSLVEELNRLFDRPLIATSRGGAQGGGAALTATGAEVLAHYRAIERRAAAAASTELAALSGLRLDISDGK